MLFADGFGPDDFDITKDGTIYLPSGNTMVQISPTGKVMKSSSTTCQVAQPENKSRWRVGLLVHSRGNCTAAFTSRRHTALVISDTFWAWSRRSNIVIGLLSLEFAVGHDSGWRLPDSWDVGVFANRSRWQHREMRL